MVLTSSLPAFKALQAHYDSVGKSLDLRKLFSQDEKRFHKFSREFSDAKNGSGLLLDFSKNLITERPLSFFSRGQRDEARDLRHTDLS
ncbi:glucose-6-phosphate isomerase [Entomophthora muscae]|uniref:Glucose-6-phosphate isomerase n=1 Tax=Entomophthora muscae TaxID=34485 RepID=A0ACC2SMT8_9FUNG|nr:glucose-6-phosphate isomerase [Entomophthora muscae]